jgi:hypothetical protein
MRTTLEQEKHEQQMQDSYFLQSPKEELDFPETTKRELQLEKLMQDLNISKKVIIEIAKKKKLDEVLNKILKDLKYGD